MRQLFSLLLATLGSIGGAAAAPVLLISVDGLHPAYVTDADRHGLKIPALRQFVQAGAHARGVIGVVPTVTYPNHTTLVTGVAPDRHGIVANTTFDPLNASREGWYWYAEDIKAMTLWQAAASAGLSTASVNWPVTVGERNISFLLPEYWRASTAEDLKLLRQLDRPEDLQERLEAKLGPFVDGGTDTLESDRIRTRFAAAILREHRPQLMAVHLVSLDGIEHQQGPFVAAAYETLEAIDGMIAELTAVALANDPATVIVVVSDHGFIPTSTAVNLRTRFVDAGLIKLKQSAVSASPVIEEWQAQLWNGAGVAAVMLRDPADQQVRGRVATLLASLAAEPRNGVARILDKAALTALGGFPGADFLVEFTPGFYLGSDVRGELIVPGASKGTHGYLPDRAEMHASFFIRGATIEPGRNLGVIDMRQIAPTLAAILGVRLPREVAPALPVFSQRSRK